MGVVAEAFAICKLFNRRLHFWDSINSLLLVFTPLRREMSQGVYIKSIFVRLQKRRFFSVS